MQAKRFKARTIAAKFRHDKKGQFVIIVALLIATLTLATAFSIHEINVHRQSITYMPVDEFLLGTTSDMSRALAFGLKNFTTDLENNMTEEVAMQDGLNFMGQWNKSMLTAYSNYGLRINSPFNTYFDHDWSTETAYSSALMTYDFDVDSYGFIGWAGVTYKYVQLNITDINSDFAKNGTSSFKNVTWLQFQIHESIIGRANLMPISSLADPPDPGNFRLFTSTSEGLFVPFNSSQIRLSYQGDGNYNATLQQAFNVTTTSFKLDLATPQDGIWVSALWTTGSFGRIFYLWSNTINEQTQNGTLTQTLPPISSKMNAPLSNGQINFTLPIVSPLTYNLTLGSTAKGRFYLTTSQDIPQMTVFLRFQLVNGSFCDTQTAFILNIPRFNPSSPPILETCTINIGSVPREIPAGSMFWLTILVPNYNGRLTVYYGQPYLSRIQF